MTSFRKSPLLGPGALRVRIQPSPYFDLAPGYTDRRPHPPVQMDPPDLDAARSLTRSPEEVADGDLLQACEVLEREGDWFDRTRAAGLREGIAARSALGRNAPAFAIANTARIARLRLPAWLLPALIWTAIALGIGAAMAGKALPQAAQDTLRHDLQEGAW